MEGSIAVKVLLFFILLLVLTSEHLLHSAKCNALPESFVTVVWGVVLGGLLWYSPWDDRPAKLDLDAVKFLFKTVLNLFALPIIIFESGWSLRLRDFISQFTYIMLFAILGTVINVAVVALLMYYTSEWHGVEHWRTSLAYASLISSVDPVATLSVFGKLNVDPLLFILVFGESQINDAVAITLFRSINAHPLDSIWTLVGTFFWVLLGSIFFGLVLAALCILVLRFARLGRSPAQAILLIFVSPFFVFSLAEALTLSGIITVLFFSILMGEFSSAHLPAEDMTLCSFLLKQMSDIAQKSIFLLTGIVAVSVVGQHSTGDTSGARFALLMVGFCMVARVIAVVPLSLLANGIKSVVARRLPKERQLLISWRYMLMIWHSGLRGVVSMSLVLEIGSWVDETEGAGTKVELISGTLLLVVCFLLIFGSTIGLCLKCLGIPMGDAVPRGQTLYRVTDDHGCMWKTWESSRHNVLMPLLVGTEGGLREHSVGRLVDSIIRLSRTTAPSTGNGAEGSDDSPSDAAFTGSRSLFNVWALFGTNDPRHCEAAEEFEEDIGDESDARSGGCEGNHAGVTSSSSSDELD